MPPSMALEVQVVRAGGTMDHRHDVDQDQIEEHSLPGVNMAGKEAECECDTPDEPNKQAQQTKSDSDEKSDDKQ